jgi:cellulose synthase/poly-beta-1,6-N-acetylglucosamine synthase-like glycosyltransferase
MVAVVAGLILLLAGAFLVLPVVSELWALVRALRRAPNGQRQGASPRLVFLVPAHNEELMVESCARSLLALRFRPEDRRVIVIADNCRDQTAALARGVGAESWERDAPAAGGKPQALAWAIAKLDLTGWDAVVVIDADTEVDPGFAEALVAEMPLRGRAVQAYFATLNERDNWLTRLAGLLARCRYEVTYPLKRRAGLNCPLTGNGMVIGVDLLADGGWRHFSITENWEMYADYTARGIEIRYAAGALIRSHEVESLQQGGTQRRRWMAGRLHVLADYGRALLASGKIGFAQKLDAMAELAGLSPVLHVLAALGVAAGATLYPDATVRGAALLLAGLSLVPLALATIIALVRHPEPGRTSLALVMVPVYAVWRVVVAIGTLLTLKDRRWTKTERPRRA